MSNHTARECHTHGCRYITRSATGHCPDHRPPLAVSVGPGGKTVNIGPVCVPAAAALDLANRIVDALEGVDG